MSSGTDREPSGRTSPMYSITFSNVGLLAKDDLRKPPCYLSYLSLLSSGSMSYLFAEFPRGRTLKKFPQFLDTQACHSPHSEPHCLTFVDPCLQSLDDLVGRLFDKSKIFRGQ